MTPLRVLSVCVLASIVLLWTAHAGAVTVAIIRPREPPAIMTEALVRVSAELTSVGFETQIVDAKAVDGAGGQVSRAWVESLATQHGIDAVVTIVGDVAPNAVEVWVIDKATGKAVVRRAPFEAKSDRVPETLAIRAIELLRSVFLEIDLAAKMPRNEPMAEPKSSLGNSIATDGQAKRERFGVEVGAAVVTSLDGIGPALLPVVHFECPAWRSLFAQGTLAGFGTRPSVETSAGSAQIAQAYATLGAAYRFRAGERLRPFVALSAGALHTSAQGHADSPNQGHDAEQWSFLLDGALGGALQLNDRFYLAMAAHAQVGVPYVAIRFVDAVVATSARPNLVFTFTIGTWP